MHTDSLAWRRVTITRDAVVFVLVVSCWVTWVIVVPTLSLWPESPMARAAINAAGGHGRALGVTYLWPFVAFVLIGLLQSISPPSARTHSTGEPETASAHELG